MCLALEGANERLSHGEPTFFVGKKVFVMFADNHHGDGRVAVWLPAPSGEQQRAISAAPERCFRPPYVGHRGWLGLVLDETSDAELSCRIESAWELVRKKK